MVSVVISDKKLVYIVPIDDWKNALMMNKSAI